MHEALIEQHVVLIISFSNFIIVSFFFEFPFSFLTLTSFEGSIKEERLGSA